VDRRALPEPDFVSPAAWSSVPPRTATEESLASIWRELLGHGQIGVQENFFHLGGHSLLAMQVISRISIGFGVELPVREIFESPTICALAEKIDSARREAPQRGVPAGIQPAARTNAAELLARLDELTDEQVATMLQAPELKSVPV
jgi:hypothetical protein